MTEAPTASPRRVISLAKGRGGRGGRAPTETPKVPQCGIHRALCTLHGPYCAVILPACRISRVHELSPEIPGTSIDPASSTVADLGRALAEGRLTAVALTQHYLDRIAELNPVLNAVIAVLPDALEQAAASDAARRAGRLAAPSRASRSSSRTTSRSRGRRPRPARRRCSRCIRRTRSSSPGCARRARSSWPRRTCRSGRTSGPPGRAAAGRPSAGRPRIPTRSTGTRPGQVQGRRRGSRRPRAAGGRHRDGRLDRLPVKRLRRGGDQADRRPGEQDRHRAALPVQDTAGPMAASVSDAAILLSAMAAADPADLSVLGIADDDHPERSAGGPPTTPPSSTRRRLRARGSASGGPPPQAPTP